MSVFLFIALITLAVYEVIARRPAWVRDLLGRCPQLSSYANENFLIAAYSALAVFLAAWAVFRSFYPPFGFAFFVTEVLLGKLLVPIFLGIAFGILFGYLLNSLLLGPTEGKFSTKGKALIALLLLILVLGAGGEQLLQEAGRRVSKLSLGVAEINFSAPTERAQRNRAEGDPLLTGKAFGAVTSLNSPALPLSVFQMLPDMIGRDQLYIKVASTRAKQTADPGTLSALAEAQRFAGSMIGPVGRCLSTIAEQTGDPEFIRTSLAPILPPLVDITWPAHRDDDAFARRGAAEFVELMRRLFRFAHTHAFSLKLEHSPHYADGAVQLEVACQALTYALCSAGDWSSTQSMAIRIAKATAPSKLFSPSISMKRFSPSAPDLERCAREDDKPLLIAKIERYLKNLVKTEGFKTRPYMAMMTASILAQVGQTDTALLQLENWVTQNRKSRTSANAIPSKWLEVRAINAMTVLTENWIRREGPNASIVMRTFHINRLEEALNIADELFGVRTAISAFSNGVTQEKLEGLAFSTGPPDAGNCSGKPTVIADAVQQGDQTQQVKFFTWYLSARASAAHHSLLHPKYTKQYMHLVNKAVRELLDSDFGCTVEAPDRLHFRAETLRLYGSMQQADAIAMRVVKTREALEKQLRSGLSAIDLGIRMIIADAEREIDAKADIKTPTPILERLSNSETIETYESLLSARAQLLSTLQQLD